MLAKPLPLILSELRDLLVESLPETLKAMRDLLPEGTEKSSAVINLQARLQQLNKDKIRGLIDSEEYARRIAQISADTLDLIDGLEEVDFMPPSAKEKASKSRQGSVLYRVPHKMPLRKPSICTIRVALDEDAILEDIVLDDDVKLRAKVEVSDRMSAELLDTEGQVFEIFPFNAAQQNVRETGYTQWLFRVTPLKPGQHQLLVKVSLLEFDQNTKEYLPRDVSILETVTIVTEAPELPIDEEIPFQHSGEKFSMEQNGAAGAPSIAWEDYKSNDSPIHQADQKESVISASPPAPGPSIHMVVETERPSQEIGSVVEAPVSTGPRPGRTVAMFLLFLVVGSSATWALTPGEVRDWWVASILNTESSYAAYIDKHQITSDVKKTADEPQIALSLQMNERLEKAYYRRALRSERLADLRTYQENFPSGKYQGEIRDRIRGEESRYVADIEQQPDYSKIEKYLTDFPDATQLNKVKKAAERLPAEQQRAALPLVQNAYVRSMELEPSAQKFELYRRDYPKMELADEMIGAASVPSELRTRIQSAVDSSIVHRVENAASEEELSEAVQLLKRAGSGDAVKRMETVIEKKPPAVKKKLQPQLPVIKREVNERTERQKLELPKH